MVISKEIETKEYWKIFRQKLKKIFQKRSEGVFVTVGEYGNILMSDGKMVKEMERELTP